MIPESPNRSVGIEARLETDESEMECPRLQMEPNWKFQMDEVELKYSDETESKSRWTLNELSRNSQRTQGLKAQVGKQFETKTNRSVH